MFLKLGRTQICIGKKAASPDGLLFLFQTCNRRNNSPGGRGKVKTMHQLITVQTATLRLTNSISRSPLRRVYSLIPLGLALFAFAPAAQAVSPAADGGYPGTNTA